MPEGTLANNLIPKPKKQKSYRDTHKWLFLLLIEIGQFGLVYSIEGISTLQVQLEKYMGLTEIDYARLIQAKSVPGLIVPIFAGVLTDYYGASAGFISGIVLVAFGQLVITIGILNYSYTLFFIGIVVKSSGFKIFYLGKAKMIRLWYRDSEMGKVTSISMVVTTLAGIACDIGYPNIYQLTGTLLAPFIVAFVLVVIAFIASLIQAGYHSQLVKRETLDAQVEVHERQTLSTACKSISKFSCAFWLVVFASVMETVSFSATKMYESKFLQTKFKYTAGQAGFMLAGGLALTATIAPIAGVLVDKFGYLPQILIFSALMNMSGIGGNAIIPGCDRCFLPAVPLALMCAGSGIKEVVMMSAKMRLLEEKKMGFGLALFSTVQSLYLLIYPGVVGKIAQDTFKDVGYYYVFLLNLAMATISLLLMVWLLCNDYRTGRKLQRVPEERTNTFVDAIRLSGEKYFEPRIKKLADKSKRAHTTPSRFAIKEQI